MSTLVAVTEAGIRCRDKVEMISSKRFSHKTSIRCNRRFRTKAAAEVRQVGRLSNSNLVPHPEAHPARAHSRLLLGMTRILIAKTKDRTRQEAEQPSEDPRRHLDRHHPADGEKEPVAEVVKARGSVTWQKTWVPIKAP